MQIIIEHKFSQTYLHNPLKIRYPPPIIGEEDVERICVWSQKTYKRTKYGIPQDSISTGVASSNTTCLGIAFIIAW